MRIVGLTGGIGMGKSNAAQAFRDARVPVFDADRAVHALQRRGGAAVGPIGALVPDAVVDGAVSRPRLRAAIRADASLLAGLERILHPMVGAARRRFLHAARRAGHAFVVLDVPLLFETGGDLGCDLVVVVSAPADIQRRRVRARGSMTEADAAGIVARQMDDRSRRARADVVLRTGLSRGQTRRALRRLIARLRALPPRHGPPIRRGSSLNSHHTASMRTGMKRPRRAFRSPGDAGSVN